MRSLLFVPGDSERKIAKGLASSADALILDLEDAVAEDRKEAARGLCAEVLAAADGKKPLFIRINPLETAQALPDLAAVIRWRPFGIMLPKCLGSTDIQRTGCYLSALEARDDLPLGSITILPIITETATAMLGLSDYARQPADRVYGMLWGGEDLAADIGARANRDGEGRYTPPYAFARTQCLLAASAASVKPIDAVYTDFRDLDGLRAEAEIAARDGFVGKAAIHPDQVDIINQAFTPTESQLNWARRVVAAFEASGAGVAALDGRMLDRPHHRAALGILSRVALVQDTPRK
jgi:citrate lyase subunit beta/citryl-CoA lyase